MSTNTDGGVTTPSAYTGVPVAEARGLPFAGLPVHSDDVEEATAIFAAVQTNHREVRRELRVRRSDGVYRRQEIHIVPLADDNERGHHPWMLTLTDIELQRTTRSGLDALAQRIARNAENDRAEVARWREQTRLTDTVERLANIGRWRLDLTSDDLYVSDVARGYSVCLSHQNLHSRTRSRAIIRTIAKT